MSDNKVNNKLNYSNVKQSQLNGDQVLKGSFSELKSGLRVYNTSQILNDAYTHFSQTVNSNGQATSVEYFQASDNSIFSITFSADVSGSLASEYIIIEEYLTKKTIALYTVVSGSGSAPEIADEEYAVNIATNDPAAVVRAAYQNVLSNIESLQVQSDSILSAKLKIEMLQFGASTPINVSNSSFTLGTIQTGQSFKVGEIYLEYDTNNNPIFQGNTLAGQSFNPYNASFESTSVTINKSSSIIYSGFSASLADGEELDSGWIDMEGTDKIQFSGSSSASGMTSNIISRANENQTPLETPVTYEDGTFYLFNIICRQRYMRFKWTNNTGSTVTNVSLEIKQSFGSSDKLSVLPVGVQPTDFSQAALTQSILRGRNSDGDYVNIGANDVGALNTSSFLIDVARNKYPTYTAGLKFGRNSDIDVGSDPEDVWNGGSLYTGQPTTGIAETIDVFSDDSDDTSTGSGARTIRLLGLDIDGEPITEELTLNGTTAVTSTLEYWRLPRIQVLTAGTDGENQGEITARHTTTTANVFAVMPAFANQTAICADTVPAGKRRIILALNCHIARANGSAGSANSRFLVREQDAVFRAIKNIEVTTAFPYDSDIKTGIVLEPLTDMKWQIFSVSDNNTVATAEIEYIDIDIE